MQHHKDCRWEKTTDEECQYRNSHEYCPHIEHACNCKELKSEKDVVDSIIEDGIKEMSLEGKGGEMVFGFKNFMRSAPFKRFLTKVIENAKK